MSDELPAESTEEPSDEDKIRTVRVFHDQVMAAVLDGTELAFFERVETFFRGIAKRNYDRGLKTGWGEAFKTMGEINKASGDQKW